MGKVLKVIVKGEMDVDLNKIGIKKLKDNLVLVNWILILKKNNMEKKKNENGRGSDGGGKKEKKDKKKNE